MLVDLKLFLVFDAFVLVLMTVIHVWYKDSALIELCPVRCGRLPFCEFSNSVSMWLSTCQAITFLIELRVTKGAGSVRRVSWKTLSSVGPPPEEASCRHHHFQFNICLSVSRTALFWELWSGAEIMGSIPIYHPPGMWNEGNGSPGK